MSYLRFLNSVSDNFNSDKLVEKFSGKKILVVGSGPSTREITWENLEFDSIITCNNFFKNDKLATRSDISHISLQPIVDLYDKTLQEYLDTNVNCTIGFEPHANEFYNSKTYLDFVEKYRDRIVLYNIIDDGFNKSGVGTRLICFVSSFQPSDVYWVGIDGYSKKPLEDPPNAFRKHSGGIYGPESNRDTFDYAESYRVFREAFTNFAKSINNFSVDYGIKIYNLGEGLDYNMITEISKNSFPLPEQVRSKLYG
tara:strand:- start:1409 stop:2170 length:762 start_codon:yes stop_codon:yes gene_type:complete